MNNQTVTVDLKTVLRVEEAVFFGIAAYFERPKPGDRFTVSGTTFRCKNKTPGSMPVVGEIITHSHAPLKGVHGRILRGKFIQLSPKKAEEFIERYFSRSPISEVELCEA